MMIKWQVYALGSAFFAGLTAVLAKIGIANINSNLATWVRTLAIMIMLSAVISIRREWLDMSGLNTRGMIFLILSGLTTGLSWLCYFKALQIGQIAGVSAIDKLSLVFAVLLAVLFLGDHIGRLQWCGIFLMSLGSVLIVSK